MDYLVLGDQLIRADEQDRDIAVKMCTDRDNVIARNKDDYIDRFFPGYDPAERDAYIEEENTQAVWHVTRRSIYELEKQILEWKKLRARVLVVGTPDHTRIVSSKVNCMSDIDIVGFVPFGDKLDECESVSSGDNKVGYPVLNWEILLKQDAYDVILVSSHEYMYEIVEALKDYGVENPIYEIYDNASRSLMITTREYQKYPHL